MMSTNKKGSMQKATGLIVGAGIVFVIVAVFGIVQNSLTNSQTVNSVPWAIAQMGENGTRAIASQFATAGQIIGLVLLVVAAVAILLALILVARRVSGKTGGGKKGGSSKQQVVWVR